jgi:hypothetical protein
MLLGTGYSQDLYVIIAFLFLVLFLLRVKRKYYFKILAKVNKLIIPSLYKKDIGKLKSYEKVILGYRYWVTKNSL